MMNEKTNNIINAIKYMREKEKLKLAICLADSNMPNISYDKKELLAKLERRLQEFDEEHKTTIINMAKHSTVMLTAAMITQLPAEEQNKIVMFLINKIKIN